MSGSRKKKRSKVKIAGTDLNKAVLENPVLGNISERPAFKAKYQLSLLLLAVLLGGILAFFGITNHLFWDDEANTAIFARNFLKFKELTAWDGKNLIAYQDGNELNGELINVYLPPLQYYVTAGSFYLFGESTFTARLPFVVLGLLTIALTFKLCGSILGRGIWANLCCFLLSVNVAFLLYIRNCRYYSLAAFFSICAFAHFVDDAASKRARITAHLAVTLSICALFFSNYLNAASAVLALPCFLVLKEKRDAHRLKLLLNAVLTSCAAGLYSLAVRNPFANAAQNLAPAEPFIKRFSTFFIYHLLDLGIFEYFPIVIVVVFFLPFLTKRLYSLKPIATKALVVLLSMIAAIIVTSIATPQKYIYTPPMISMRYLVPLIPVGAIASTIALQILWKLSRYVFAAILLLLIFSNVLYLGFLPVENYSLPPKGVQCTLCKYVIENLSDYTTVTEKIINYMKSSATDKYYVIHPSYMMYAPMFYFDDKIFCHQFDDDSKIDPDRREELPKCLFRDDEQGDIDALVLGRSFKKRVMLHGNRVFMLKDELGVFSLIDTSRPEIPWHAFSQADARGNSMFSWYVYGKSGFSRSRPVVVKNPSADKTR